MYEGERHYVNYFNPIEFQKGFNYSQVVDWYKGQEYAFFAVETELKKGIDGVGISSFTLDSDFIKELLKEYTGHDVMAGVDEVKKNILDNYNSWKTFIDANRGPYKLYAF